MSLDDLINITIEADTLSPTRPGFGVIALLASKVPTLFPTNVPKTYSDLVGMTDDGFLTSDPAYKCAAGIFAQKTRPEKIKVWARTLAKPVQEIKLQVLTAGSGTVLKATIKGTAVSLTLDGSTGATVDSAATALGALIDDDTTLTVTVATDTVTIVLKSTVSGDTDGLLFDVQDWSPNLALADTSDYSTASSTNTVEDDLSALLLADTDWYGIALDSNSKVEILDAAHWAEANKKFFVPNSSDTACEDPASTTDVIYAVKAAGYARTGVLFNGNHLLSYSGASWMANRFPFDPGSFTFAFKQLGGVSPDPLTPTQFNAIQAKHGNTYMTVAGVPITFEGKSGAGEYLDVTQFIDWLRAEMQIDVFTLLATLPKVPYTDLGTDMLANAIQAVLKRGIRAGGIDAGNGKDIPAPSVSFPRVADVPTSQRAARHLPGGKFGARLAGAIHTLDINGVVTV